MDDTATHAAWPTSLIRRSAFALARDGSWTTAVLWCCPCSRGARIVYSFNRSNLRRQTVIPAICSRPGSGSLSRRNTLNLNTTISSMRTCRTHGELPPQRRRRHRPQTRRSTRPGLSGPPLPSRKMVVRVCRHPPHRRADRIRPEHRLWIGRLASIKRAAMGSTYA